MFYILIHGCFKAVVGVLSILHSSFAACFTLIKHLTFLFTFHHKF